jgi:hypothetical protein
VPDVDESAARGGVRCEGVEEAGEVGAQVVARGDRVGGERGGWYGCWHCCRRNDEGRDGPVECYYIAGYMHRAERSRGRFSSFESGLCAGQQSTLNNLVASLSP